jgi:predicted Kef-type K+ transport protein
MSVDICRRTSQLFSKIAFFLWLAPRIGIARARKAQVVLVKILRERDEANSAKGEISIGIERDAERTSAWSFFVTAQRVGTLLDGNEEAADFGLTLQLD